MKIISFTYEQSRLAYFKEQRDSLQKKLDLLNRKIDRIGRQVSSHRLEELFDQASDLGMKIEFYEDAIKALDEEESTRV